MASLNETKTPQQQANHEHPTPPSTPAKVTLNNAETTQDQAQQGFDMGGSVTATDASSSEPSIPEQETEDKNITQPSSPAETGT